MNSTPAEKLLYCSQCGQAKSEQELARFGNALVCGTCKPAYVQSLSEGGAAPKAFHYAGFWIRFVAAIIDGLIVGFASTAVQIILVPAFRTTLGPNPNLAASGAFLALAGLVYALSIALAASYESFFVYKLGATPGKMALGLKVVRPDGGPVSLGRSFGRYFAKILSMLVLMVGYIMAAFDGQKRALHDMLVDTRVIRKSS